MSEPPSGYRPCVGVMLLNRGGQVFVGQRRDTPGAWQMPQGGIDPGETVAEAAFRELQEETGVTSAVVLDEAPVWLTYDLPPELAGRLWGGRWRGQAQRWVALRFTGRDDEIQIETDEPEFTAWRWAGPAEILSAIVPFKRPIYERVFAAFARHLDEAG